MAGRMATNRAIFGVLAVPVVAAAFAYGPQWWGGRVRAARVVPLCVEVIKSTAGLVSSGTHVTVNCAGIWVPDDDVAIVAVSIPEQTDVALYTDIEVSTAPIMYQTTGHIFRVKYSGPRLYDYGAAAGSTYTGALMTNSNIAFPAGHAICVGSGVPVNVHLDVINGSLIDLTVEQDIYIYYRPLRG